MKEIPATILTTRLDLLLLTPAVLRLSLEGDSSAVEEQLGLRIPSDWYEEKDLMRLRLQQLTKDPSYGPWSIRTIVLREQRMVVGRIGFHTKPGTPYLKPYAPDGVEFGYTVYPPFRRQGYAREACLAMMGWANEKHQISEFILTISPSNIPSLRLAEQLGFVKVGSHIDEEDGPEDIFRLDYPGRHASNAGKPPES